MAPNYAFATQLGIGTTSTVDVRLDFLSESIALDERVPYLGGIRGTRSKVVSRVRTGERRVHGGLSLNPSAVELASLLPWILGANASGTTYALADTVPTRYISVDRTTKVFTYDNCRVNRATFRAVQGAPMSLDLDIVGVDETEGNSGTFPSLSIDTTTTPFMLFDLVLTVNSAATQCKEFTLVVDNHLDTERLFNSQTLSTAYNAQDRDITFRTTVPYGDASALYGAGEGGVAATAVLTNGAVSLTFSMASLVFPRRSPVVPPRGEIMLPIDAVCYRTGSTLELVTTLDSTP